MGRFDVLELSKNKLPSLLSHVLVGLQAGFCEAQPLKLRLAPR
jgi:hypothetical protein